MEDLKISIKGEVTASNFMEWNAALIQRIDETKTDLVTDEDFADADVTIKSYKAIEKRLDEVKQTAMEQSRDIMALFDSIDKLRSHVRDKRLVLNRQLTVRKKEIRVELIDSSIKHIRKALLWKGGVFPLLDHSDLLARDHFSNAIKGKSSLVNAQSALDRLIKSKINEIDQRFDLVTLNERLLGEAAKEYEFLFHDRKSLLLKTTEDLERIISTRILDYKVTEGKGPKTPDVLCSPKGINGDGEVATPLTRVDKEEFTDALKTVASGKNPFTGSPFAKSLFYDADGFARDLRKLIEEIE